ncbi:hypothetical protein AOL_s00215g896 [Orbilia oligospora ATCC 24927]|uniref:Peptidase S8/S53 domain-containing protein n=2 Tax=Orbilia oligospora TaxID=2813651 RepID=G1XV88_ARTOA|nr:hypothetical protein AOL_s00215g896 [Orbilia oligospora ATCC 24927]EGX42947.1 hypothetical protein AOL_s00215g896 [Orbilia oligospora ATCC 24927]KAF3273906.1 hypothetical protein TWF970_008315 [Orbilia oligospora]
MRIRTLTPRFFLVVFLDSIINNAHARPWEPAVNYTSKIGTLDQYIEIYYAILKKEYRMDMEYKKLLLEWAEHYALEPRQKNIYATEHESFGLLAMSISVGPNQTATSTKGKLPLEIKAGLTGYQRIFGDAVHPQGEPFHEDPPPWLRFGPADHDGYYLDRPKRVWLKKKVEGMVSDAEDLKRNSKRVSQSPVEGSIVDEIFLDLQVISQPPGTGIEDLQGNFWNFKNRGDEQLVYVVDTGCDMDHPEVSDIRFRKDWIFAGAAFPSDEKIDSHSAFNYKHGTAVTGRVAGKHTGVAQDAEIVIVKTSDGRGSLVYDTTIDALLKVYSDIQKNHPRNCIVNYSAGWYNPPKKLYGSESVLKEFGLRFHALAYEILSGIAKLENAILVAAAGNGEAGTPVDIYPAMFGGIPELQDRFVVVGGYDPESGLVANSWADYIRVVAPSVSVNVAGFYIDGELAIPPKGYLQPPTELQKKLQLENADGTSFACPTVAGVIATLLGAGVPLVEVVPYLYSLAYPRVKNGPNVVYNGIKIHRWPQSLWPSWYAKTLATHTKPVSTITMHGSALKTKYATFLEERSRIGTKTISVHGSARKTLYTSYWKRETKPTLPSIPTVAL